MNQEYALARWRVYAAKGDPKPYTVRSWRGRKLMWLTIAGNTGWHHVAPGGKITTLGLDMDVSRLVGPRQKQKIATALQT